MKDTLLWRLSIWSGYDKIAALSPFYRYILYILGAIGSSLVLLGIYWSIPPKPFDVEAEATAELRRLGANKEIHGFVTTATLIKVSDTLIHKHGGYLLNDRFPPGIWLDNMPHWELGVLTQIRDLVRVMRRSIARSQSQSLEDKDLMAAEPHFNTDARRWVLPSAEAEFQKGINALKAYELRLLGLQRDTAHFYARADNLADWLGEVNKRLGSLSQRLSASVGQKQVQAELTTEQNINKITTKEEVVQTPWWEIDDVFYEARGAAWALIHFLKAAELDFHEVLERKNALISLRQIIRNLEATQDTLWCPIVLNGSGYGFLANYSLTMTAYIAQANAALIDLRDLLEKG